MKKLFKSRSRKTWHKIHARNLNRRKQKSKQQKKHSNRQYDHLPKRHGHSRDPSKRTPRNYSRVKAPETLSIIKNPAGVLKFVSLLSTNLQQRKKTFVDLRKVIDLTYGGLVILLAIMVKFKSNKIKFNGSFPAKKEADRLLHRSGFFDNLYNTKFRQQEQYEIISKKSDGIITHADKRVSSVLANKLIGEASMTIWGEKRKCQGVQRTLIELMLNTNNHADIYKPGEKHWWLSVEHHPQQKMVSFSFLDFGVGIFTNLANKPSNSKWFNFKEKIRSRLKYGNNAEILRLILQKDLHKTVTGKSYRGKGLPSIAESAKKGHISNLHIITNDVFCNYDEDIYEIMSVPFSGTFVYWELCHDNSNTNFFNI